MSRLSRRLSIGNVHLDLGAGRRGVDMGPSAIHLAGLEQGLLSLGHEIVERYALTVPSQEMAEIGEASARFLEPIATVCAQLADRTAAAVRADLTPVVLGGDHSVAIGTISGMARAWRERGEKMGVIWVDAHTDMNTPQTSPSGNIHGMPLATLLGYGHPLFRAIVGEGSAIDPQNVCVIGARQVDPTEVAVVREAGIRVYTMSELDDRGTAVCVREAVERASNGTVGIHLSFDLDGVDPQHAPGVGTPVYGGLTLRESHLICEKVAQTGRLLGIEMVELNPVLDEANRTGKLAVWLIRSALGLSIL